MALSNLSAWNNNEETKTGTSCGSACGSSDKPAETPAACGSTLLNFLQDI